MINYLKTKGVTTLLTVDDDKRISYSLSKKDNNLLISQDCLIVDGMNFARTDIRIERDCLAYKLFKHRNDEELVVFAHEWAMYSNRRKWIKLAGLLVVLKILGCDFIIN